MLKKCLILLLFLNFFTTGCSIYTISDNNWEGITDNTLKIVIAEFFPFSENLRKDDKKKIITERLNQRASLLISSHITTQCPKETLTRNNELLLNSYIHASISKSSDAEYNCNDHNYCKAYASYDISEIQNHIKSILNE